MGGACTGSLCSSQCFAHGACVTAREPDSWWYQGAAAAAQGVHQAASWEDDSNGVGLWPGMFSVHSRAFTADVAGMGLRAGPALSAPDRSTWFLPTVGVPFASLMRLLARPAALRMAQRAGRRLPLERCCRHGALQLPMLQHKSRTALQASRVGGSSVWTAAFGGLHGLAFGPRSST